MSWLAELAPGLVLTQLLHNKHFPVGHPESYLRPLSFGILGGSHWRVAAKFRALPLEPEAAKNISTQCDQTICRYTSPRDDSRLGEAKAKLKPDLRLSPSHRLI